MFLKVLNLKPSVNDFQRHGIRTYIIQVLGKNMLCMLGFKLSVEYMEIVSKFNMQIVGLFVNLCLHFDYFQ